MVLQAPGEGLLVDLDERRTGRPTSGAAVAAQWFAQPIFGDADVEDEDEAPPASTTGKQQPKPVAAAPQALAKTSATASIKGEPTSKASAKGDPLTGVTALPSQRVKAAGAATLAAAAEDAVAEGAEDVFASSGSDASDSFDDDDSMPDATRLASHSTAEPSGSKSGFEEVPVSRQHATSGAASSDESSDDGFSDLDDDGKAEVLALAKKMLRGRDRQDILDGAYHRYAFHENGLPDWFEADERRHMK